MLRLFPRRMSRQSSLLSSSKAFRFAASNQINFTPRATLSSTVSLRNDSDLNKYNGLFDVSHITAVVTGGATGIGLMISQALVSHGAKVYIIGRRENVLEESVKRYGSSGSGPGSLHALQGDVSDKDDVLRITKELEEKEGGKGIHLLVNNAGVARDNGTMFSENGKPKETDASAISEHFLRSEPDQWATTFKINVTAGYYMSMALLPLLAKGTEVIPGYSSQIVNVSSISGAMKTSSGGQFAYASSKAAFTHMSRMLAMTFKDVKVRVNVIAPGVFPSEMTTGTSGDDNKSTLTREASNPAGRFGNEGDMGATILFLAGQGGQFYNHQILYPDGDRLLNRTIH